MRLPASIAACAAAALLTGAATAAQPAREPSITADRQETPASAIFAREALRICIDTAADPSAIRGLAGTENWSPTDPSSVPVKSRVTVGGEKKGQERVFERAAAWTLEKEGVALTVGLFDAPDLPRAGKQCELMAWDLDATAVAAAFKSDPRLRDESVPGFPVKLYAVTGTPLHITYVPGDQGSRVLHALNVH
jgi:hypothetical protein